MKFRYVYSAPAMLKLFSMNWIKEYPQDFERYKDVLTAGIKKVRADSKAAITAFDTDIDLLFNGFTEQNFPDRFNGYGRLGFNGLFADSGGLQMLTTGMDITPQLKREIYEFQAKSDYAMCFDEIPCDNYISPDLLDSKTSRVNLSNRVYHVARQTDSARTTAENIKEQVEIISAINDHTKVFYIIHGNKLDDYVKWFEEGTKILGPEHWKHIGGVAIAGTCMGSGPLEAVEAMFAYKKIRDEFGVELTKDFIHLLGVGGASRIRPYVNLAKSKLFPDDFEVSFDSTTFSSSFILGTFSLQNGQRIPVGSQAGIHQFFKEFYKHFDYFFDQHFPDTNTTEMKAYILENIRSVADICNNAKPGEQSVYARLAIPLAIVFQCIGFFKRMQSMYEHDAHAVDPISLLNRLEDFDQCKDWLRRFSNGKVKSVRISRQEPKKAGILSLDDCMV